MAWTTCIVSCCLLGQFSATPPQPGRELPSDDRTRGPGPKPPFDAGAPPANFPPRQPPAAAPFGPLRPQPSGRSGHAEHIALGKPREDNSPATPARPNPGRGRAPNRARRPAAQEPAAQEPVVNVEGRPGRNRGRRAAGLDAHAPRRVETSRATGVAGRSIDEHPRTGSSNWNLRKPIGNCRSPWRSITWPGKKAMRSFGWPKRPRFGLRSPTRMAIGWRCSLNSTRPSGASTTPLQKLLQPRGVPSCMSGCTRRPRFPSRCRPTSHIPARTLPTSKTVSWQLGHAAGEDHRPHPAPAAGSD